MTGGAGSPTFLLGVGAQKAGTTWLFDYLNGHPDCAMGPVKEMRFFSDPEIATHSPPLTTSRETWAGNRVLKQLQKGDKLGERARHRLANQLDALLARYRPEHYADAYRALARRHPEARLIGDISPEYGSLDPRDMQAMGDYLAGMGYPVKVVMLLRDPVGRAFSMARMKEEGRSKRGKAWAGPGSDSFADYATGAACELRTRYERMIPALEQVFDPAQIFYGIYEDFFRLSEIERLCAFLGIEVHEPQLGVRSNAGQKSAPPDPESVARVRGFYADTYAFCRDRFGAERIDALWGRD